MSIWVFSDLHLEVSPFYEEFIAILKTEIKPKDTVVFAGDIFDLFVGPSARFTAKFSAFFETLKSLAGKQVPLHYIYGNHDFFLDEAFQGIPIEFHDESVILESVAPEGPKKIYIAHGDLVDESDVGYLRMRSLFRSTLVKNLVKVLPGAWIERIASSISRKADQKVSELPEGWPTKKREALRKCYREFAAQKVRQGFDFVILGHCHDLDEVAPFYWNMGYPPVHRQALRYDSESGRFLRYQFAGIPRKN